MSVGKTLLLMGGAIVVIGAVAKATNAGEGVSQVATGTTALIASPLKGVAEGVNAIAKAWENLMASLNPFESLPATPGTSGTTYTAMPTAARQEDRVRGKAGRV